MTQVAVCDNQPSQFNTVGFAGHIPGLRDQIGVTYGCATKQLLQPEGLASRPEWTGPTAVMPQWSTPGTNLEERPAWLGATLDYYTAPPVSNRSNMSAVEVGGQGRHQGRFSRRDILGKQYEFPCRPEWKHFERPRHVADVIETCIRRPLSNDEKTVILRPPPCDDSTGKDQQVHLPFQSKSTVCNFNPPLSSMSPYDLPVNHPDKFINCGYTGALPYSKSARVDANYPDTTRYALNRRMCENMRHQRRLAAADDTKRNVGQHFLIVDSDGKMRQLTDEDCCPRQEQHQIIYPTHSGMIPNYTGHLPGYRWRLGHTFGLATRNMKRELRSRRAPCS